MDFESGGVTVNVQGAATDGHPVLYDIFYLVQYLLDIKGNFIPSLNCRSLIKQHRHARRARVIFLCEVLEIGAFMVQ